MVLKTQYSDFEIAFWKLHDVSLANFEKNWDPIAAAEWKSHAKDRHATRTPNLVRKIQTINDTAVVSNKRDVMTFYFFHHDILFNGAVYQEVL